MYAAVGEISRDLITYRGKVLVHNNRGEMEFVLTGVRIIELPGSIKPEETMPLRDHPQLGSYRWPLRKDDFR